MYTQTQIDDFVKNSTGIDELDLSDDLADHHGVYGDDFHELLELYSRTFNVDMTGYIWYFHTSEEGSNFGGMFFRPPNKRVPHIPITTAMLHEFANTGKWSIEYPEHSLPRFRWDRAINFCFFIVVLTWALYSCLG
jgi:hypothetical protein